MRWPGRLALGAGGLLACYAAVELAHGLAERSVPPAGPGPLAVLVLGYPTPASGRPNAVQRWRTEITVAALRERPGVAVFSGGRRRGPAAEADTMAGYALRLGLAQERILTETTSQTTRQNIERSLRLMEQGMRLDRSLQIAIASDPLHAARARKHLIGQRPRLADRLVSAGGYRFGAHPVLKTASLSYEVLFGTPDRVRRWWGR